MRKKLPRKISILGKKYSLKIVNEKTMGITTNGVSAFGCIDLNLNKILLLEGQTQEQLLLTLMHEVIHLSNSIVGLDQVISLELQEIQCESSSNAIMDLLRALNG